MKTKISLVAIVILIAIQVNLSCKKETSCEGCRESNKAPVAIAGPDQVITLPTDSIFSLDGSASNDPDGTISEWLWTKISGPASFNIRNALDSVAVVSNVVAGIYEFELEVTDNGGLSGKDTVLIIVNDSETNQPPVPNAGVDATIIFPSNTINLDGNGSTDPDNNIVSYEWTKILGPSYFTILNTKAKQTQVVNLVQGIYQFELKVTDAGGLFAKDTVQIDVSAVSSNWTRLTNLPPDFGIVGYWNNGGSFLMEIDGKIYAGSSWKREFWEYRPHADIWISKGVFPGTVKEDHSVNSAVITFSVQGKGYCAWDGQCWQYDPVINKWTQKSNQPFTGNWTILFVKEDKVYVAEGNKVYVYDPAANTNIAKNDFPEKQVRAGFMVNDENYCIGENGKLWKYDFLSDSWNEKASLPQDINSFSFFSSGNYGYLVGDMNHASYNRNALMQVWRYDPVLNKWDRFAEDYPGIAAYHINTVSLNGVAYVGIGFHNGDFPAMDFWRFGK